MGGDLSPQWSAEQVAAAAAANGWQRLQGDGQGNPRQ